MRFCIKKGCNNKSYSKDGLCQGHYKNMLIYNKILRNEETTVKTEFCIVEDCEEKTKYKNMCGKHYKRKWRHGNPEFTMIDMTPKIELCKIEGCKNVVLTHETSLCKLHYQRHHRYGRTENIISARGKGSLNNAGYRVISVDGQRIYEHIHLAEKALGRKLPAEAVVHHMNGNPSDNSIPFNLIICPDQAYHLLLHHRMKKLSYFREINLINDEL